MQLVVLLKKLSRRGGLTLSESLRNSGAKLKKISVLRTRSFGGKGEGRGKGKGLHVYMYD